MRSIFLVGFMGCGKTTVGRILAERLSWPFVDIDLRVSETEGKTIAELFEAEGESGFRSAERRALASISGSETVVSTGGGLFADPANRRLILEIGGWSVFLDVPWSILAGRLGTVDRSRPMWDNPASARALFDQRQVTYLMADAVVTVGPDDTECDVTDEIIRLRPE